LLNPVVWYVNEKKSPTDESLIFLTNSADTMHLARDFGIPTKNIHQLRSTLGMDENETQTQENSKKDTPKTVLASEPKTLFSYNDVDSDEEEVVFKPRGRGPARGAQLSRGTGPGAGAGAVRGRGGNTRSPRTSFSTPAQPASSKPQIPVEEIDPDSFDRGSFARGSTPLVNTSNHVPNQFNSGRGAYRGNYFRGGRGANFNRGYGNGFERGATRGRGRLFVP
jgi:thiosulfate/3-mercaptopyruvate sulfurtransferase